MGVVLLRDNNLCNFLLIVRFYMHLLSWLEGLGRMQVTQPLSEPVHANDEAFMLHTGLRKLGLRQLRRSIYLQASGQQKYRREAIDPAWRRGIWLYRGVPQIGDALMDLAPRSLLKAAGLRMDLYTDPHIAALFEGDPWFGQVSSSLDSLETLDHSAYDFVIVQSYKSRSLKEKTRFLKALPWTSIHGFYTGPEFHRADFATRRLSDLTRQPLPPETFAAHARQKLRPLPQRSALPVAQARPTGHARVLKIALAVGGVDPLRTYTRWRELAQMLEKPEKSEKPEDRPRIEWTLLGSSNGQADAQAFAAASGAASDVKVVNLVGQTSLAQCRQLIQEQDFFIGCDGGLMHLAVTTGVRLIALFNCGVRPEWRLPPDLQASALMSATPSVNDIAPGRILETIKTLASQPGEP